MTEFDPRKKTGLFKLEINLTENYYKIALIC